jgi:hypothetical protein
MLCLAVGHGKGLVNSVPCNDVDYLEIKEWIHILIKGPDTWRMFRYNQKDFLEVVDGEKKGGTCIYYEWRINPMNCIFR